MGRARSPPQTCPHEDEEGFTLRPDVTQNSSGGPHGCSSSDSDYEDEDKHPKIYVRIKPLQPCDAAGSGQAAVEQLKATVGNLPLPPGSGGAVKRQGVEVELAGSGCRMSLVKKMFATGIYLAGS